MVVVVVIVVVVVVIVVVVVVFVVVVVVVVIVIVVVVVVVIVIVVFTVGMTMIARHLPTKHAIDGEIAAIFVVFLKITKKLRKELKKCNDAYM